MYLVFVSIYIVGIHVVVVVIIIIIIIISFNLCCYTFSTECHFVMDISESLVVQYW